MPNLHFRLGVLVGACCLALANGRLAGEEITRKEIYQRTLRATTWVQAGEVSGSGFLIDAGQRLLITNHHVVGNHDSVLIVFPDYRDGKVVAEKTHYREGGKRVRGKVIDSDPRRDLAVIELENLPPNTVGLKLATASPRPAIPIHSLRNPSSRLA